MKFIVGKMYKNKERLDPFSTKPSLIIPAEIRCDKKGERWIKYQYIHNNEPSKIYWTEEEEILERLYEPLNIIEETKCEIKNPIDALEI